MAIAAGRLDQAEVRDVATHGGLGDGEAAPPEERGELLLAADGGRRHELEDGAAAGGAGGLARADGRLGGHRPDLMPSPPPGRRSSRRGAVAPSARR